MGWNLALTGLLAALIARLWLVPLTSSFWVDEMVTAFVVRYGPQHWSFAVAPQVPQSLYYPVADLSRKLFGESELAYRVPSLLFLAIATVPIARLAARLIHPQAAWFAVFACFALRGFNYQAADARPYAMGTAALAAALLFLVRWFDSGQRRDAAFFVLFAALLLPIHLTFWPSYCLIAIYAAVRLARRDTPVRWFHAAGIGALVVLAIAPAIVNALALLREAGTHVIVDLPRFREVQRFLHPGFIAGCAAGAAALTLWLQKRRKDTQSGSWIPASAAALILGWWLCQPLGLFLFSHVTGNSVFVPRYLAIALPGVALTATAATAYFLRPDVWRPAALLLGLGVLISVGEWGDRDFRHDYSDWRSAANLLQAETSTPILCPSPFIEAQGATWRPDYRLPGFLYSHLDYYSLPSKPYLLPFRTSPEAERNAIELFRGTLSGRGRFYIYGGDRNVRFWRDWFLARPELRDWTAQSEGTFGNIEVILVERGPSR